MLIQFMVKEWPAENLSLGLSVSRLAAWCSVLGWDPSCGYSSSLISCKLKVPLAAATAPWLLILVQSLSLQEALERPFDSSDLIKNQRNTVRSWCLAGKCKKNEPASLSPREEQVAFVFVNQISLWMLSLLASLWDWNANYLSTPPLVALSPSPSLPKCKALTHTPSKRDRERQHTILHLRAHKQIRRYWLEPQLHSYWCSSQ